MFSGKKVVLTKPQIQDADVLQKWYLNKEFRQLYDGYTGNSLEMIMEEIRNGADISDPHAERLNFLVSTKHKNIPIGVASISDIDRQNGHARISLGIADTSRRLGWYGIDLMIVLCDIVFYQFGFNRCYMRINDNNQLAIRTATNFGFRVEGQLRSHIFTGGEYVDQWVLGLLKDEYEKISIVSRWKARSEQSISEQMAGNEWAAPAIPCFFACE